MHRPSLVKGEKLMVKIDRLSVGGKGVARHEGFVVFVPDTLPGEMVEIEVTKVKSSFAEARLVTVTQASEHRVAPACPVASTCGGCDWQHINYPEQLRQKRELLLESLGKFTGIDRNKLNSLVGETVPSPNEFRYRNRIQLHHYAGKLGYHRRGSHDIVDITDCLIAENSIVTQLERIKPELAKAKPGRIEIHATHRMEPGGFSQVNSGQNQNLVTFVIGEIQNRLGKKSDVADLAVFDLFAGAGNFSLPLARLGIHVTAVELNAESVSRAQSEINNLSLFNLRFVQNDVAAFLRDIRGKEPKVEVVLLDPPRAGCSPEVVDELIKLNPTNLVYVSCDPVTLARDLKFFFAAHYCFESATPFDMFPQTSHVETVTVLSKIS